MPLPIPIPHHLVKDERALSQTLSEICRRAVDGTNTITANAVYVPGSGGGIIVTTPDGSHQYIIGVSNNGAVTSTLHASSGAGSGFVATTPNGLHTYLVGVSNNGAVTATKKS